ncbi:MAG TPA: PAS domain-containing protein [Rhizomicrobium sp.]
MSYAAPSRPAQQRAILDPALAPVIVDWELQFSRPPLKRASAYWSSLCGERKMPRRQELSPSRMREFLPHVNLIDIVRESPDGVPDFIVTLQGQHGYEIYGALAHRPLDEALPPLVAQRWRQSFLVCCHAGRPVRFRSQMSIGGKAWLEGEVLVAPLGDEETGVQSLFAVFACWQAEGFGSGAVSLNS